MMHKLTPNFMPTFTPNLPNLARTHTTPYRECVRKCVQFVRSAHKLTPCSR